MSENKLPELVWPARMVLRDTKVIADEGQRIFSTATGYGYEKREYVRADITSDLLTSVIVLSAIVRAQNGNLHDDITALLAEAETAIARAEGR